MPLKYGEVFTPISRRRCNGRLQVGVGNTKSVTVFHSLKVSGKKEIERKKHDIGKQKPVKGD